MAEESDFQEECAEVLEDETHLTVMLKVKSVFRFVSGWMALLDLALTVYNVAAAARGCARRSSATAGWELILQICSLAILLVHLAVSAVAHRHALFLSHPVLFLGTSLYAWRRNRPDGLIVNCAKTVVVHDLRCEDKRQEAVASLVAAFLSACRAAVLVNLIFKFQGGATVILSGVLVLLEYIAMALTQCRFCVAIRRLGANMGLAICLGCLLSTFIIYGLPVIVSYLIWTHMREGVEICIG